MRRKIHVKGVLWVESPAAEEVAIKSLAVRLQNFNEETANGKNPLLPSPYGMVLSHVPPEDPEPLPPVQSYSVILRVKNGIGFQIFKADREEEVKDFLLMRLVQVGENANFVDLVRQGSRDKPHELLVSRHPVAEIRSLDCAEVV